MKKFANQSVLITGAGGGIGRALCQSFAKYGAVVIGSDKDQQALQETFSLLDSDSHLALVGELSDTQFCDSLAEQAANHTGRLDVVVNNAGIIRRGKITETTDQDWQISMQVNVESVFRICRASIAIMQAQTARQHNLRGAIVNMASCWGLHPGPDHVAYCTSKAAVAAMTQCLARDHASDGIRVNAVCPNEVNTNMLRSGFAARGLNPDSAIEQLNRSVPLGRIAEAQDIADAVTFLASDEARYICGSLLEVNGAKPVG